MRSYLSLIPISAKVHRRQNRMTLLCIIFAVFLVTAIFSMVDLMVRCETEHSKENHGFWHIAIQNLSEEGAGEIRSRGDVAAASWYDVVNMDQSRAYEVDGIQTALCGIEESFRTDIMSYFPADSSIQANDAAILTPNARELLGVDVGESITLRTPAGEYSFLITRLSHRRQPIRYQKWYRRGDCPAGKRGTNRDLHERLHVSSDYGG